MKQLIYQLLPRLWANGRFSGVDAPCLAYFKDLGVNALWYTGVIRHATRRTDAGCTPSKVVKGDAGSPYAITDYYDVNPYLADEPSRRMEEFQSLVERTHGAGMKVIIDFVPNHVAREYTGAVTPAGERPLGADDDFYVFPGEPLRLPVEADGYTENPARASGNCFTPAPGINDWYETVKLNYGETHTATWDKMYNIVRYWAQKGVDGFRCDMVELVPPQFMQWLIARIKAEFPTVLFIAEVYEKEKYRMYVEEVGFDLLYDKSGLYDTLRAVTCSGASAQGITWNWQFLGDLQPRMLNFLENHDEQRVASSFFCGTPEAGYAALAVSLLLNNAPFMLYFGQEIAEAGMDAEGFSGLDGRTTIFDWWSVKSLQRLRQWIANPENGLLAGEREVLRRYREILALSRRKPFAEGLTYDLCYCQDAASFDVYRHYAFLRSDGQQGYLVMANFSHAAEEVTVRIPVDALQYTGIKAVRTVYTLPMGARDYVCVPVE